MATAAVSLDLEEYLNTSYRPDREYIDGELLERNVGQWEHAFIQSLIAKLLGRDEARWGVLAVTEWRVQVSATRVRIPDLTVVPARSQNSVLSEPPLAVIEVLSPRDTYADTERRSADYLHMGVHAVWIIDPQTRSARQCVGDAWTATSVLRVPGTPVELSLEELFNELDKFPSVKD